MCLIVDANRAGIVFGRPDDPDSAPIHKWLRRGGIIVYGHELKAELGRVEAARRMLNELGRSGRARDVDKTHRKEIDRAISWLAASRDVKSDDPHVLALARATGARVLHTHDQDLIDDFGNGAVICGPRGKVYKTAKNTGVLKHSRGCLSPVK